MGGSDDDGYLLNACKRESTEPEEGILKAMIEGDAEDGFFPDPEE